MFRTLFPTLVLVAGFALPALARDLAQPNGDVILTVSGTLKATNVDGTAQFDLKMLEALDATTFETTTIWTEGEHSFTCVSLELLVDQLGLEGETLRAKAINDYAIDIPLSDAVQGGPIVAYRLDGDTMSVRDKGPLWIVYPYDANADYPPRSSIRAASGNSTASRS
jgi:hypothetical protein